MTHAHPPQLSVSPADRNRAAQKATWVSVVVNLVLTLAQLIVGWLAHSQSLIAHGLHSFSDLLSDFLVIWASHQSAVPADRAHPYGHGRVETAATLALGTSLILIGAGILWESGKHLHDMEAVPSIEMSALWIAVLTVVAKEGLYRYLIRVAEKLRSQLLTANALHTRADAASALVVVVGIGGALLGWPFLDLLAAAVMGFMILRMGGSLAWGAIMELIDTALDETQVEQIRATLLATPGVYGLHELRTRRMAHQALVDAHIQVDARISVSEGHRIAESARARVLRAHPEVLDVLVHVDPEDDLQPDAAAVGLPGRDALMAELRRLVPDAALLDRVVLHYVGGQIEVDLMVGASDFPELSSLAQLEVDLGRVIEAIPAVSEIRLNYRIAPK